MVPGTAASTCINGVPGVVYRTSLVGMVGTLGGISLLAQPAPLCAESSPFFGKWQKVPFLLFSPFLRKWQKVPFLLFSSFLRNRGRHRFFSFFFSDFLPELQKVTFCSRPSRALLMTSTRIVVPHTDGRTTCSTPTDGQRAAHHTRDGHDAQRGAGSCTEGGDDAQRCHRRTDGKST